MRSISYISNILLSLALCGFTGGALATSMDDCRKRVIVAIENAKALGGTQADEEKLGNFAANECVKEVREAQQDQTKVLAEESGGISPVTIAISLAVLAMLGYFAWTYQSSASKRARIEDAEIAC